MSTETALIIFDWDGEEEQWAVIARFPAYSISSHGRVRRDALVCGGHGSVRRPKGHLKQRPLPLGHMQVTLCMGNKPMTCLVHRLVAEAFLPSPRHGQDCVCHRDDDPSNNRPHNLFWGTRTDNSNDKVGKNRQARGEMTGTSKLLPEHVRQIRRCIAAGQNQYEIAAQFGITQSNVSMIANRQTWRHLP